MKFHLNRKLQLHSEIKHKSLYDWAICEAAESGEYIGRDQIPWEWTHYFTAIDCIMHDGFIIEPDYSTQEDNRAQKTNERQAIIIRLRPGSRHDDQRNWRQTRFSMFGTGRAISNIELRIYPTSNPDEKESCRAWGSVSYTSEVDFRDETQDDALAFNLFVKLNTFARYADMVRSGSIDEIIFSAGQVSGFYSEWSPSISTTDVKVLTTYKEQPIENISGLDIEPPRLGAIGECALRINRQIDFRKTEVRAVEGDQVAEDHGPRPIEHDTKQPTIIGADLEVRNTLRSLMNAAWWAVGLLAVIAIRAVWH